MPPASKPRRSPRLPASIASSNLPPGTYTITVQRVRIHQDADSRGHGDPEQDRHHEHQARRRHQRGDRGSFRLGGRPSIPRPPACRPRLTTHLDVGSSDRFRHQRSHQSLAAERRRRLERRGRPGYRPVGGRTASAQQQFHHRRHRQQQRQRHRPAGHPPQRRGGGIQRAAEPDLAGVRPLVRRPVQPGREERRQRHCTARRTSICRTAT